MRGTHARSFLYGPRNCADWTIGRRHNGQRPLGGGFFGVYEASLDIESVTVSPSEVPLPAAPRLFASALIGGGVIAWRKRREQAQPFAA